jgi:hypothetical protein
LIAKKRVTIDQIQKRSVIVVIVLVRDLKLDTAEVRNLDLGTVTTGGESDSFWSGPARAFCRTDVGDAGVVKKRADGTSGVVERIILPCFRTAEGDRPFYIVQKEG